MRSYFVVAVPAVLLSLALVHCKSSDDSSGSTGSSAAREQFITSYCELATPCCATVKGTAATCASFFGAAVPASFDEASGTACIAAIRAKSTTADFCANGLFLTDEPACATLQTRGAVAVGGSCNDAVSGYECAAPASGHVACVFGNGGSRCQTTVLGNEGDACVEDSNDDGSLPSGASLDVAVAATGTYCNRASGFHCSIGKCVKLAAVGASCTDSKSCALDAYCPFADPPSCLAKAADGTACVGDSSCLSNYCDTTKRQCSPTGAPVFLGAVCNGG